jgi:hypothetical protein
MVEVTNEDEDMEGDADEDTPKIPKDVEDSSSDEESEDDLGDDVPAKDDEPWSNLMTHSRHSVRAPSRLVAEVGTSTLDLTNAE